MTRWANNMTEIWSAPIVQAVVTHCYHCTFSICCRALSHFYSVVISAYICVLLLCRCILGKAPGPFVDLCGPRLDMQSTQPYIKSLRSQKSPGNQGGCKATCKPVFLLPWRHTSWRPGPRVWTFLGFVSSRLSEGGAIVPKRTANVPSSSTAALTRTRPRRWAPGGGGYAAAGRWTWPPWKRTPGSR